MGDRRAADESEQRHGRVGIAFTGKDELAKRASAEEDGTPADYRHAEEIEQTIGVCDGLIRKRELNAAVYDHVADEHGYDDRNKTRDQFEVFEHDRVADSACHAETGTLAESADDQSDDQGNENGSAHAAGTFRAGFQQNGREGHNEEDHESDRESEPFQLALLIRTVQGEALFQRDRADYNTDNESEETDDRVQVAAADTDHHAERAAEEYQRADHDQCAEHETGERGRTALRLPFFRDECHDHGTDHQTDDFRTVVLNDTRTVESHRTADIAKEAGDTEAHVLRVSELGQQNCCRADYETGQDDHSVILQETVLFLFHIYLHIEAS